jgi:gliding motility-associated-like protein
VTDVNGCKSLTPSAVTINVRSDLKVFAGNDTAVIINQPFQLSASDVNNSGFVQYNWSPAFGLNDPFSNQPVSIADREITYTVTAVTASGCIATDEIRIKVYRGPEIYVPNAFTPNADGRNDVLKAIPVGIKQFKYFAVYNRWGQEVFRTSNAANGWDGKVSNVVTGSSTFVWKAEGVDSNGIKIMRNGVVTLVK